MHTRNSYLFLFLGQKRYRLQSIEMGTAIYERSFLRNTIMGHLSALSIVWRELKRKKKFQFL